MPDELWILAAVTFAAAALCSSVGRAGASVGGAWAGQIKFVGKREMIFSIEK